MKILILIVSATIFCNNLFAAKILGQKILAASIETTVGVDDDLIDKNYGFGLIGNLPIVSSFDISARLGYGVASGTIDQDITVGYHTTGLGLNVTYYAAKNNNINPYVSLGSAFLKSRLTVGQYEDSSTTSYGIASAGIDVSLSEALYARLNVDYYNIDRDDYSDLSLVFGAKIDPMSMFLMSFTDNLDSNDLTIALAVIIYQ